MYKSCQWLSIVLTPSYLYQNAVHPEFDAHILFTDEGTLNNNTIFNTHNSHVWISANPFVTSSHLLRWQYFANTWAGIIHDHLLEHISSQIDWMANCIIHYFEKRF